MRQIAIVILAAGRGFRFEEDSPKVLAKLGGQSLVSYALAAAHDSGLAPILLVVGYDYKKVASSASSGVKVIHNPHWKHGIASSLQAALRVLEPNKEVEAVCIGLADQPCVGPDSYCRLVASYYEGASIAVATYRGARRNPVLLARSIWSDVMKLEGDEGARQLMQNYPVTEVDCDDTGDPQDIDTKHDLEVLEINILNLVHKV